MLLAHTGALWTIRLLWLAMMIMLIATLLFAVIFSVGYVLQTWYPRSKYAQYFNETDLFTFWMTSMASGVGLAILLYAVSVLFIGARRPVETSATGLASLVMIAAPFAGILFLLHMHRSHRRRHSAIKSVPRQAKKSSGHKNS